MYYFNIVPGFQFDIKNFFITTTLVDKTQLGRNALQVDTFVI